jgi:ankyrin repeat protein
MPMPWNKDGKLFSAVKASNYYDVKSLLDRGADPNAIDMADRPILLHATVRGNPQIVEALLKKAQI